MKCTYRDHLDDKSVECSFTYTVLFPGLNYLHDLYFSNALNLFFFVVVVENILDQYYWSDIGPKTITQTYWYTLIDYQFILFESHLLISKECRFQIVDYQFSIQKKN